MSKRNYSVTIKTICLLLCLVCTLTFISCDSGKTVISNEEKAYYSFKDSTGNEVTLSKKPQKVAVLFSSYADIWKLSGGTVDITVGESVERNFADGSAVLVDEGSGHTTINLEQLYLASPELVIGTADYECQVKACEFAASVGIPSALFKVESLEDYLYVLKIMCDINSNPVSYVTHGTEMAERARAAVENAKNTLPSDTKILFVRAGSSARSTKAKTAKENFVCAMLDELGTHNIADTKTQLLDGLSLEYILTEQPDFIFISTMGNENASKLYVSELFKTEGWSELECVKNGAYAFLPKELFHYKPNAKWDTAYTYLIDLLLTETDRE